MSTGPGCEPETAFQVMAACLQVGSQPYFGILGARAVILPLGLPERIYKILSQDTSQAIGSVG